MSGLETRIVDVNGHKARVWEKGRGPTLGYLPGLAGAPVWSPFLEELSKDFHVVAPSLPGFPGSTDYDHLDTLQDWLTATLDLIEAAELSGADFVGSSVGAMLALEVAALSPGSIGRLALMAPLGLHLDSLPIPHIWARKSADMAALMCADTEALAALQAVPEGEDAVEWNIMVSRVAAASGRLLWPMCEIGLIKRLHRVRQPVFLLWGSEDRITSPAYAKEFASRLSGPVKTGLIDGAGHLVDIDAPEKAAMQIRDFLHKEDSRQQRKAG
ncbi:MAG: alpha/beta fold hydrolase [Alphaproteobacteria bacterium]|nr:alpha/beta fold hydrolase [Alphaproteobacteria bacterium]